MTNDEAAFEGVDDLEPDRPDGERWSFRSAADIAQTGVPAIDWEVEGLLEQGDGPLFIIAPPEAFKSWISLHLAQCSVTGAPFLGRFRIHRRKRAIVLNFDAGSTALARRVALTQCRDENFFVTSPEGWSWDRFDEVLETNPDSFVVMDCFADIFHPDPHDDQADAMRTFIRKLRRTFTRFGCNGIVIDHSRRPSAGRPSIADAYYGSVQKKAAVRSMWTLERLKEGDQLTNRVAIYCEKMSEGERFAPFIASLDFGADYVAFGYGGLVAETEAKPKRRTAVDDVADEMLGHLREHGAATREHLDARKSRTRRDAFKKLLDSGTIRAVSTVRPERFDLISRVGSGPEHLELQNDDVTDAITLDPETSEAKVQTGPDDRESEQTRAFRADLIGPDEGSETREGGGSFATPLVGVDTSLAGRDHWDLSPVGVGPGPKGPLAGETWSPRGRMCSGCRRNVIVRESDDRCRDCIALKVAP